MSDVFKLMVSGNITESVVLSENMKRDVTSFVERMEAMMPNQPLQDSIQRNEEFIRQVLDEMKRIFVVDIIMPVYGTAIRIIETILAKISSEIELLNSPGSKSSAGQILGTLMD